MVLLLHASRKYETAERLRLRGGIFHKYGVIDTRDLIV